MALDPATAALVVHDLKNALGAVEAALLRLAEDEPFDRALARRAHEQCHELRQRFVTFLTLYGAGSGQGGALKAWCSDESPAEFLRAWVRRQGLSDNARPLQLDEAALAAPDLPAFAWFDPRLLTMALDAAAHNAQRFARQQIVAGVRAERAGVTFWLADDGPGLGGGADPAGGAAGPTLNTGLGTELCRAVARSHANAGRSGEVRLFNRVDAQGRSLGAQFELWLP
jgi:signal transduction histidine kinase